MSEIQRFLGNLISQNNDKIKDWFKAQYQNVMPCFYSSVDLRHNGYKLAPVDTNLFPAGFNNLSENSINIAKEKAAKLLTGKQKIFILAESHTRNTHYHHNIYNLVKIIQSHDRDVEVGMLDLEENLSVELENGTKLLFHKCKIKNDEIILGNGFKPDLVILNNDLTSGKPELLDKIKQDITPSLSSGWFNRSKFQHFQSYNQTARAFANIFNFDHFLISTDIEFCKNIDFKEQKGIDCIANNVEKSLSRIKDKYAKLSIKQEPYVYVKADQGTYGMGMMHVKSGEEIYNLNKKARNKMNIIKSQTSNARILIQEGIETIDTYNNMPTEPFIYQIGGETVGTILRSNKARDSKESLNAVGAEFASGDNDDYFKTNQSIYSLIASLASLAATKEDEFGE